MDLIEQYLNTLFPNCSECIDNSIDGMVGFTYTGKGCVNLEYCTKKCGFIKHEYGKGLCCKEE